MPIQADPIKMHFCPIILEIKWVFELFGWNLLYFYSPKSTEYENINIFLSHTQSQTQPRAPFDSWGHFNRTKWPRFSRIPHNLQNKWISNKINRIQCLERTIKGQPSRYKNLTKIHSTPLQGFIMSSN